MNVSFPSRPSPKKVQCKHPLCGHNMHTPEFSNSNSHHSFVICDNFNNNASQHKGQFRCILCYCQYTDYRMLLVIPLWVITIITKKSDSKKEEKT